MPTNSLDSHQNIRLHTGARVNVVLLTYLLLLLLLLLVTIYYYYYDICMSDCLQFFVFLNSFSLFGDGWNFSFIFHHCICIVPSYIIKLHCDLPIKIAILHVPREIVILVSFVVDVSLEFMNLWYVGHLIKMVIECTMMAVANHLDISRFNFFLKGHHFLLAIFSVCQESMFLQFCIWKQIRNSSNLYKSCPGLPEFSSHHIPIHLVCGADVCVCKQYVDIPGWRRWSSDFEFITFFWCWNSILW